MRSLNYNVVDSEVCVHARVRVCARACVKRRRKEKDFIKIVLRTNLKINCKYCYIYKKCRLGSSVKYTTWCDCK